MKFYPFAEFLAYEPKESVIGQIAVSNTDVLDFCKQANCDAQEAKQLIAFLLEKNGTVKFEGEAGYQGIELGTPEAYRFYHGHTEEAGCHTMCRAW